MTGGDLLARLYRGYYRIATDTFADLPEAYLKGGYPYVGRYGGAGGSSGRDCWGCWPGQAVHRAQTTLCAQTQQGRCIGQGRSC